MSSVKRAADKTFTDSDAKRARTALPNQPVIACPYSKHPEKKHTHKCRNFSLRTIADLKLHLHRCHELDVHCPTCQNIFTGANRHQDRDNHIRDNSCEAQPEPTAFADKLPQVKIRALFGRQWRQGPHEAGASDMLRKWFYVWDGIFPGTARPDSIYHHEPAEAEQRREARRMDITAFNASEMYQRHLEHCSTELPYVSKETLNRQNNLLLNRMLQFHGDDSAVLPPPLIQDHPAPNRSHQTHSPSYLTAPGSNHPAATDASNTAADMSPASRPGPAPTPAPAPNYPTPIMGDFVQIEAMRPLSQQFGQPQSQFTPAHTASAAPQISISFPLESIASHHSSHNDAFEFMEWDDKDAAFGLNDAEFDLDDP
ncbi:hypothetical protein QBC44DRAFT_369908 [Cladorrhinum sp. PSN332]|nr:hypothetical protein QBC44DRAFT_369908 [Cladorrhinum sp. PSN332]